MATSVDFHLPQNLTIANVQGLHDQLEALVGEQDCDKVTLQAEDVQRADTAGIQLLLAFVHASKERQIAVDWKEPSDKLRAAAKVLGLDQDLGLH
ncbi:hypothetical protein TDB9533_02067 [Thalassocella blandensis]|nr:hypothetical protein TDB9533_02067 [Thalassocella blandensis]